MMNEKYVERNDAPIWKFSTNTIISNKKTCVET